MLLGKVNGEKAASDLVRRPDLICCGRGTVREKIQWYSNNGSEASLVQNGHFASVSASKRTLTSQENLDELTAKTAYQTDESFVLPTKIDDAGASCTNDLTNDLTNVESRAAPSYLKLSRAIGGYTPYNAYVSIADHERIRTEKSKLQPSNKQLKDTECVLQNGGTVVTVKQPQCPMPATYGSTESRSNFVVCEVDSASVSSESEVRPSVSCNDRGTEITTSRQSASSSAFVSSAVTSSQDVPFVLPQVTAECCHSNDEKQINAPSEDAVFATQPCLPQVFVNSTDADATCVKDGKFFLNLVDSAAQRLEQQCAQAEMHLKIKTSEEAEGKLRAAIGKANLLITKKFQQFRELCHANLDQKGDEQFKTTVEDLSGFWDMVLIQVEDVDKQFEEIERMSQTGWKDIKNTESVKSTTPATKTTGIKAKAPKSTTPVRVKTPSSSSSPSSAAAKAREEARKRLTAAKAAGRQRKASESDKDIEIFVS